MLRAFGLRYTEVDGDDDCVDNIIKVMGDCI